MHAVWLACLCAARSPSNPSPLNGCAFMHSPCHLEPWVVAHALSAYLLCASELVIGLNVVAHSGATRGIESTLIATLSVFLWCRCCCATAAVLCAAAGVETVVAVLHELCVTGAKLFLQAASSGRGTAVWGPQCRTIMKQLELWYAVLLAGYQCIALDLLKEACSRQHQQHKVHTDQWPVQAERWQAGAAA